GAVAEAVERALVEQRELTAGAAEALHAMSAGDDDQDRIGVGRPDARHVGGQLPAVRATVRMGIGHDLEAAAPGKMSEALPGLGEVAREIAGILHGNHALVSTNSITAPHPWSGGTT